MTDAAVLPAVDAPVEGLERSILADCMDRWPHLHPDPFACAMAYLDANAEIALWGDPAAVEDLRRHQRQLQATLEIHTERRLGHS